MKLNLPTFTTFIDFSKALDSIDRNLMLYKQLINGVDGNFYKAIKSLYSLLVQFHNSALKVTWQIFLK